MATLFARYSCWSILGITLYVVVLASCNPTAGIMDEWNKALPNGYYIYMTEHGGDISSGTHTRNVAPSPTDVIGFDSIAVCQQRFVAVRVNVKSDAGTAQTYWCIDTLQQTHCYRASLPEVAQWWSEMGCVTPIEWVSPLSLPDKSFR